MNKSKKTYYFKEYTDDVVESKNQTYKLNKEYMWLHKNLFYKCISEIAYFILWIFGYIYCKLTLRIKIKNKRKIKKYKNSGYFIFGNHTQTIGDVFIPALVCGSKRVFVVVSPANLGIPVIGKILPMVGALPIPDNFSQMKLFYEAIKTRIEEKKCVVIYPEAHVWPYYTQIRDFKPHSFKLPVELDVPIFSITTTYQKRKFSNKPKATVYIDGPFFARKNAKNDEKIRSLYMDIFTIMKKRCSENNNYEYIKYIKKQ